ncbi:MAG: T9SS type A sorting domain-containing protein, partial [Bacteroidales bacterium]
NSNGTITGETSVYEFIEGNWIQVGADINGLAADDRCGWQVSLSKDGLVVASGSLKSNAGGDDSGQVRVFRFSEGAWEQAGTDFNGTGAGDHLGMSVSLNSDGSRIAMGGFRDEPYTAAGRTDIYEFVEGSWVKVANSIYGVLQFEVLGGAVTLNGDGTVVAAGAFFNPDIEVSSGLVRAFGLCSPLYGTDVQTGCYEFTWIDGITYTEDNNTATFTLESINGCDSIVTLDLTIITVDVSVSQDGATLTANAAGAEYQWMDCNDSYADIAGATSQSFTASSNGSYSVLITQNGCQDITSCYDVTSLGINADAFENKILVYPNPTDGIITIEMGKVYKDVKLIVRDITGRRIAESDYNSTKNINFYLDAPAGIYLIELSTEQETDLFRVVKR